VWPLYDSVFLQGGVEGKRQVDKVIDKCDTMQVYHFMFGMLANYLEQCINYFLFICLIFCCEQNLREAIATYRNSILRQSDEMKREASLSFFVEYLERYYFLICFAVYVHSVSSAHQTTFSVEVSFSDWMRARPELYSILRR
jgi:hypothetical protein